MLTTFLASLTYSYSYGPSTSMTTNSKVSLGTLLAIYAVILLVWIFLFVIPVWKIFKKFGRPGWAAIIPIYNTWVVFEIVGYPGWWAVLSIIPIVNLFPLVMLLVAYFKLAKLFGKSDGFAVCTVIFSFICIPILGYGKAQPTNSPSDTPTGPVGGYTPQSPVGLPPNPVSPPTPPTPPNPPMTPPVPPTPPTPPVDQGTPPTQPPAPTPPDNSNQAQGF